MKFLVELQRRNVIRAGLAYGLFAWALLQVVDFVLDVIGAPNWIMQTLVVLALAGLPAVLVFAWVFELTPEGFKRDAEVPRERSARPQTARRLDGVILVSIALLAAFLIADRFQPTPPPEPATAPAEPAEQAASKAPASEETPVSSTDAAVTVLPTDGARSIAVLPFVNMSPDPDNEYFADGVSEEILNVLVDVEDLRVAARTSSFAFKGSALGIAEIAEKLGVEYVLEGSVRKAGDQLRITAQLIQAKDGFHLWSETYDRRLTNIFAIQDEIADNIARVLEVELAGGDHSYTRVQDLPPELYEKFLKARFLVRRRNEADTNEAIGLLREVTAAEPQFPDGLALLAEALSYRGEFRVIRGGERDPDDESDIGQLVSRALALEPDHALAYLLDAWLVNRPDSPLEIILKMRRAIELDPSEQRPHHWLSIRYMLAGYLERGKEEAAIAVELDPDQANARGQLGLALQLLGSHSEAETQFREQLRLGNPSAANDLVDTAVLAGDLERARNLTKELPWSDPADADRIDRFLDVAEDPRNVPEFVAYLRANPVQARRAYLELMTLGEYEAAYELYNGNFWRAWAEQFADARALPEFQSYIRENRLPEVWDALGPPPACRKAGDTYDCAPEDTP
ncbi:MAG: hypothetical protein P8008_01515 [Gammaproteobacteria bacterium]